MKLNEEIMEILEAFDLTQSNEAAARLTGCDPKTVARYVAARDRGNDPVIAATRDSAVDPYRDKIEEWREIVHAENKDHARRAVTQFADEFGTKWPKAVAKVVDDQDALLAFYDFPVSTFGLSNPIESTFAPVRARTNLTKGPGSRAAGLAMVFKLIEAAERRWRKIDGHELVALVRAGARFRNGKLVEADQDEKDVA